MSTGVDDSNEKLLGQPAWRIALFYPAQGSWTETDYLSLTGDGPLVEFDNGCIEVLDMPTKEHQRIAQFLFLWLHRFVVEHGLGEVFIAPLPVRLWQDKYREPDLVVVKQGRAEHAGYPCGADLVVEIVSPGVDNRRRDMETKPAEYCRAGISEYWVIDPEKRTIEVLKLEPGAASYLSHGVFCVGETASSATYPGLAIDVEAVMRAAQGPSQPAVEP